MRLKHVAGPAGMKLQPSCNRDNGKENGNYRDYRGYKGIIGVILGYILGLYSENGRWNRNYYIVPWGYIWITGNILGLYSENGRWNRSYYRVHWGCIWIIERRKLAFPIMGLRVANAACGSYGKLG